MTPNTLTLSSPLTIAFCEEHQARLLAAFDAEDEIILDFAADLDADVSFVQLLVAAQLTAKGRDKRVRFAGPPQSSLAATLRTCGFSFAAGETTLGRILAPTAGDIA